MTGDLSQPSTEVALGESAVGHAIKTFAWICISTGLVGAVLAAFRGYLGLHPEVVGGTVYAGLAVAVVDALIRFIQKYNDPAVPNFPTKL